MYVFYEIYRQVMINENKKLKFSELCDDEARDDISGRSTVISTTSIEEKIRVGQSKGSLDESCDFGNTSIDLERIRNKEGIDGGLLSALVD